MTDEQLNAARNAGELYLYLNAMSPEVGGYVTMWHDKNCNAYRYEWVRSYGKNWLSAQHTIGETMMASMDNVLDVAAQVILERWESEMSEEIERINNG